MYWDGISREYKEYNQWYKVHTGTVDDGQFDLVVGEKILDLLYDGANGSPIRLDRIGIHSKERHCCLVQIGVYRGI